MKLHVHFASIPRTRMHCLSSQQYLYLSLLALSMILAYPSHTKAQEVQPTAPQADERVESSRGESGIERARFGQSPEERRIAIPEHLQSRITNLVDNTVDRMRAAIHRLENIGNRLETRMGKLESAGIDTAQAKAALTGARTALAAATSYLDAVVPTVSESIIGKTPRESFRAIRGQFDSASALIIEAQGQLRESTQLLKEAVREAQQGQGVREAIRNENATSRTNAGED